MTAIRIHAGNSYKYSQCCILVGENDKIGWLSCSKFYEHKIINIISENKSNNELEVKSSGK
jgi:hypothetical protein